MKPATRATGCEKRARSGCLPPEVSVLPALDAAAGTDIAPADYAALFAGRKEGEAVVVDFHNRRLKLVGVSAARFAAWSADLLPRLAEPPLDALTKLIVYAPFGEEDLWRAEGLDCEGIIRGYFRDGGDAGMWTLYRDLARAHNPDGPGHDEVVEIAQGKQPVQPELPAGYTAEVAGEAAAEEIAAIMFDTFSDYPSPISAELVRESIAAKTSLFGIVKAPDGSPVAVASGEIDHERRNAEMTDCATVPRAQGRGLMAALTDLLMRETARRFAVSDFYTLTRAGEPAVNCVFARLGFTYTGRLVNNCRMPDGWESVNIWCRTLNLSEGKENYS